MTKGEREIRKQNVLQMMDGGYDQQMIAESLGVHRTTVKRIMDQIAQSATNGMVMHGAAQITANKDYIDPITELYTMHQNTKTLYEESLRRYEDMLDGTGDFVVDDILVFTQELRKDLELQVKITEKVFNAERMRVFRDCIVETMDEVHPDMRREFVQRLNKKKEMFGTTMVF